MHGGIHTCIWVHVTLFGFKVAYIHIYVVVLHANITKSIGRATFKPFIIDLN